MSSALKPVLTPSGAQNPPVPPQLNKPMHPQGAPTTYGQPMSHIPQNLVNIPHNAPSSTNVHNPAHSNTHNVPHHINTNAHVTGHSANHYSLNVPNASQHYPVSGNAPVSSHSAPVSNHPVPNTSQSHAQSVSTFSTPPKNLSYNPNYQANLGHSYKMPNVVPSTQNLPASQPQAATATPEEPPPAEKPQSNGTSEVKIASKPEPPQNHISAPAVKDKPPPPTPPPSQTLPPTPEKTKTTPEKPVTANAAAPLEQKQNADVNKPSEVISTPAPSDKTSASTGPAAAVSAASSVNATSSNTPPIAVSTPSSTTATSTTTEATVTATIAAPAQTAPPPVTTSLPDTQESQDSVVTVTATITNKPKEQTNQKPTLKLATTPRTPTRKIKTPKLDVSDSPKTSKSETKSPMQKSPGSGGKTKRTRIRTQPYQSPLPEVEMISKISATTPRNKNIEDKLIIFYKNEFLAVRNSEGGFYICQAVQNIYKSSPRIRIRWLSQDKNDKEIYTPDFYDYTDFDCILTNLNLARVGKGKYKLPSSEKVRTDSILKRALAVEKGDATPPSLTEEHPDGLDLSLYKEESQLKKRKAVKRKASTPLKAVAKPSNIKKYPDQPKVRKIVSKPKVPPVKKSTVLKRALSAKVKKSTTGRAERAAKRQQDVPKSSPKTSPVIDQKKAKVLAKVARKAVVAPPPKIQPPPKQNVKAAKPAASSSKKPALIKKLIVTRKSKREKK